MVTWHFLRTFASVMSIRKTFFAIFAAIFLPFGMQANAAQPHKKTTRKSKSYKKPVRKSNAKNTMSMQAAMAEVKEAQNTTPLDNSDDVSGETIVKTAMQYIGVPYRRGTSSPRGFDCSGFTSFVYKQFDISLSRSSRTQYTQGKTIKNKSELRAGDLVFFQGSSGRGGVGHVGIVTEVSPQDKTFKFVHASCTKGVTTEHSSTAYYSKRYIGARRVLQNIEE